MVARLCSGVARAADGSVGGSVVERLEIGRAAVVLMGPWAAAAQWCGGVAGAVCCRCVEMQDQ